MGKQKLLMPWGESTLIERVLTAMHAGGVSHVVVTLRPADVELAAICQRAGAEIVVPATDPAEMRVSIQLALAYVNQRYCPSASDVWLLAPADMPRLSAQVVEQMLRVYDPDTPSILVPTLQGQRGHPVLFPWSLAEQVMTLADDEGVNALLRRHAVRLWPCDTPGILDDLDTPDDYRRLRPSS